MPQAAIEGPVPLRIWGWVGVQRPDGVSRTLRPPVRFHLLLSHIWLPAALGSGPSVLWVTQAAGYVGSAFMSLFWGRARGLGVTLYLAKCVVCVLGAEPMVPGASRAVCGHHCVVWGCLRVTKSLSDGHFLSSSPTCLLSEAARTKSVAAFLPYLPASVHP